MSSFYKHITQVSSYPCSTKKYQNEEDRPEEIRADGNPELCALCRKGKPDMAYFDIDRIALICVTHERCEKLYREFIWALRDDNLISTPRVAL